jgi:hypothetical protein
MLLKILQQVITTEDIIFMVCAHYNLIALPYTLVIHVIFIALLQLSFQHIYIHVKLGE